jgi:prepilin-type N-terminal cleavage/methylation domain-containing protein
MKHAQDTPPRGFTLIELLLVVAIIGILSSISMYALNSGRERAKNARTTAQTANAVTQLRAIEAGAGKFPLVSGIFCLGGSDCGANESAVLNELLKGSPSGNGNPMSEPILFNSSTGYRAWYARCSNVSECPNDDIAEVIWFLKGATATCGAGATKCVSENGNTACILKLSGRNSIINSTAIGYCYHDGNSSSYE